MGELHTLSVCRQSGEIEKVSLVHFATASVAKFRIGIRPICGPPIGRRS
jgi:hypothetical protein